MKGGRVDYAQLAECYDKTRVPLIRDVLEFRLSKIDGLGKISTDSMVLDIGCGTDIYTIPLAEKSDAVVVGLDCAGMMIEKAGSKESSQRVEWMIGDAGSLPFGEASLDCVFMTLVIHQIVDKQKAVHEIYRVLKEDGRLVIMTKSHGQIRRSVVADFPKTRQIDLTRFPSIPKLRRIFLSAGFGKVRHHVVSGGTVNVSVKDELERTSRKYISTLTLLDEEDFHKGLRIYEERLREKWGEEMVYQKEDTFVVGEKRNEEDDDISEANPQNQVQLGC